MKGCFITVLIILTIVIASVIYLFKFHSQDVINMVKPVLIKTVKSDVDTRLNKLQKSINSDSLKKIVLKYTSSLEKSHNINLSEAQSFFNTVKDVMHDGSIDSSEVIELNNMLKKQTQNERYKKN